MNTFFLYLVLVSTIYAVKDIGKFNLIKLDLYNVGYKKLMLNEDGILSAPPIVLIDTLKFKGFKCFKNIRTNRWSIGIPIIFWNEEYISNITKAMKSNEFMKKFKPNTSQNVFPPCGIIAYRLNWRRRYDVFEENTLYIDTNWHNSFTDYILPKSHNFIVEFFSVNDTDNICKEMKNHILNENLQSQELSVDFIFRKAEQQKMPVIKVLINDIRMTKFFNDTKCLGKSKCYVSYEYAEKWSYEVSLNILQKLDVVHLNLQEEVYNAVFNKYLCKNKVSMSSIELETIKKLVRSPSNEMICVIPEKVYKTKGKVCSMVRVYKYPNYHIENVCKNNLSEYKNDVVAKMNPFIIFNEKNEFTIPVKI